MRGLNEEFPLPFIRHKISRARCPDFEHKFGLIQMKKRGLLAFWRGVKTDTDRHHKGPVLDRIIIFKFVGHIHDVFRYIVETYAVSDVQYHVEGSHIVSNVSPEQKAKVLSLEVIPEVSFFRLTEGGLYLSRLLGEPNVGA